MARIAITLGYPIGGGKPQMIAGPEVSIAEQKAALKSLKADRANQRFVAMELWESGFGVVSRIKFRAPETDAAPSESEPTPPPESELSSPPSEPSGEEDGPILPLASRSKK